MTTIAQARLEINDLIFDAWALDAATSSIALVFENVKGSDPPTGQDVNGRALPWGRVSIRHLSGGAETLGQIGQKRFLYEGMVSVEIYTPIGDGTQQGDAIAYAAQTMLRGVSTASGVWFTEVRSQEVGLDSKWYRQDVVGRFSYEDR